MKRFALLFSFALFACGSTSSTPSDDGGPIEGGTGGDAAPDATADAMPEATTDAAPDATADAQLDASADATPDAPLEASADAGAHDGGNGCTASGGTVSTSQCCGSTGDFPNTCLVGACGCSPANSHSVQTCVCPASKCFDGASCK